MSSFPAPPQLSPDGKWWWTGAEWVPANQAPSPPEPPSTPPPPSASAASSVPEPATASKPASDAAPSRELITSYKKGQLFVEGRDIVLLEGRKEFRGPLAEAELKRFTGDRWTVKVRDMSPAVLGLTRPIGLKMIRGLDNEPAVDALLEGRKAAEMPTAARDIAAGTPVQRRFGPNEVSFEGGYLKLAKAGSGLLGVPSQLARVPTHMVQGAGSETRQIQTKVDKRGQVTYAPDPVLAIYGGGTKLGEASFFESGGPLQGLANVGNQAKANEAADWINAVLRALHSYQEQVVREARDTGTPLVKCLYCGTRAEARGLCAHCGAPLPEP